MTHKTIIYRPFTEWERRDKVAHVCGWALAGMTLVVALVALAGSIFFAFQESLLHGAAVTYLFVMLALFVAYRVAGGGE